MNKVCTKCLKNKPIGNFYKYTHRPGYRPDCYECRNTWARNYGKKADVRERRNKKGDKWAQNNLASWTEHVPQKANCEVCGIEVFFSCKDIKKSIHFDHRVNGCFIKISPGQWLRKNKFNDKNKEIWDSCGFGILCGRCNRGLPTENREIWLINVTRYIKGMLCVFCLK